MEQTNAEQSRIGDFLNYLFGGLEGIVYTARKVPNDVYDFEQAFFEWPSEKPKIVQFIREKSEEYEVYVAPAIFSVKSGLKENIKATNVVWCEFDGNTPSFPDNLPAPSMIVQSSEETHQHWYWRLDEPLTDVTEIEKITRAIAFELDSDSSGWDAGQVLRPPETKNHKRNRPVSLLLLETSSVSKEAFGKIEAPPPVEELPIPDAIPDVTDVVSKYKYATQVWELFRKGRPQGQRSDGLMELGYHLAEMQLSNHEIFSMLLNADERWGKFKGRQDQYRRLMEIVVRARLKYPYVGNPDDLPQTPLQGMGFRTLLATEVSLDWIWDGYLHRRGTMLLTGPSGIGKSQLALSAAQHFVLGQDFLGKEVSDVKKMGFFSLEMALEEMKMILKVQGMEWDSDQLDVLEENFISYPLGESIYLNRDQEKTRIEELIEEHKYDGIVFDSLGSTTDSELTSESDVKNVLDWVERIKNRYGCFVWFIHHHRKASGDNKKPNKLGDVYGSQYITARASTVLTLWEQSSKSQDIIQLRPLKVRSAKRPPATLIHRTNKLHFTGGPSLQEKQEAVQEIIKPQNIGSEQTGNETSTNLTNEL